RVGLVDVLAAGTGGAIGIHPQVGRIDFHSGLFIRLGHHRNGAGGGMDPALGFGLRHALHTVRAGLEFQPGVYALAFDPGDHLAVATVLAGIFREDLDTPALAFGIARIHAEQVTGEDRPLVPAG